MNTPTKSAAGPRSLHQLVRRFPVDWKAIATETGCTRGTLCKTVFGWGIRNGDNGVDLNLCTVPETEEGESLRIEEGMWAIYRTQSNAEL